MRHLLISTIVVLAVILWRVPTCKGYLEVTQLFAEGVTGTNCIEYQIPLENATSFYESYQQYPIRTNGIGITCSLNGMQGADILTCFSAEGQVVFNFQIIINYNIQGGGNNYPIAINLQNNNLYFCGDGMDYAYDAVVGFNLETSTEIFRIQIDNFNDSCAYSLPWIVNPNNNILYYTTCVEIIEVCTITLRDGTSGNLIEVPNNTTMPDVPKNFHLISSSIGSTSMVLVVDFYNKEGNYMIMYNATTMEIICNVTDFASVISDGRFMYAVMGNLDILQYDASCSANWRLPHVIFDDYAFDYLKGYLYLLNSTSEDYTLIQIDTLHSTSSNIIQSSISISVDTFLKLGGTDSNSYIYLYETFSPYSNAPTKVTTYIFTDEMSTNKPEFTLTADISVTYNYFQLSTVTKGGILLVTNSGYTLAFQCSDQDPWQWYSLISLLTLIISLIVSILLLIKHKLKGADPPGWNKKKIPDLVGLIINSLGLVIVSTLLCFTLNTYLAEVNENTAYFSLNFADFSSEYMQDSCAAPEEPSAIDLCTCTDYDKTYQTSSCITTSCSNTYSSSCINLLQNYCACNQSLYQWSCDCEYEVNGTCSAQVTSNQLNPTAVNQWNACSNEYQLPTLLVNVMFYLVIISTIILLILNILQVILKFDNPLLDLLITLLSLLFSFLSFAITTVGLIEANQINTGCLASMLTSLPGCSIQNSIQDMEVLAAAYLQYSFINLYSTPLMYFISAIPDLLSLCVCVFGNKSEHLEALGKLKNCLFRRNYSSLN